MAGRKRTSEATTRETRSAKATKTDTAKTPKNAGKEARGAARLKTSVSAASFRARALPIHVNLSHTAPVAAGAEEALELDPGFVGSTTLAVGNFTTGSFGWKGQKRLTIELPAQDGGEKETVHVQLSINATIIGSKDAKEEDEPKDVEIGEEAQKEVGEHKEAADKEGETAKDEHPMEVEEKAAEKAPEEATLAETQETEPTQEGENGNSGEN